MNISTKEKKKPLTPHDKEAHKLGTEGNFLIKRPQ